MATNVVYDHAAAIRLELTVGASKSSGDVIFLNDMPVLLMEDSDSNNKATCILINITEVVDLSVVGEDGSGNSAVAVGDGIYLDGTTYNKDDLNGKLLGYALETVSSGNTSTIQVALRPAAIGTVGETEINYLNGVTAGTVTANKAAVVGANKELDEVHAEAFYLGAGAGTQVTSTAAELNILDGVTATATEINTLAGAVAGATFTIGAEATNVINVGIQLEDVDGNDVAARHAVRFYLADDANGDTPSGTAPNGGIAIGTDGALIESVDNLSGTAISEADGDIDIDITDSGTPTFYLILVMPNGSLVASGAITFA